MKIMALRIPESILAKGLLLLTTLFLLSGCATTHRHFGKSTETGLASWYGNEYAGHSTASGEIFDPQGMTAAHRTHPFNSWVRVTNLENGKEVDVRINDRGPFIKGRVIDVSYGAAKKLEMVQKGLVQVRVKPIKAKD